MTTTEPTTERTTLTAALKSLCPEDLAAEGDALDETREQALHQMIVGVAVERAIATTGRCVCGRRPTVRDRVKGVLFRLSTR